MKKLYHLRVSIHPVFRKMVLILAASVIVFVTNVTSMAATAGDKTVSVDRNLSNPSELPQQNRISGIVTDAKGQPLAGVNVVVTGTTTGTLTDISGKYTLDVPPGSKSLTFSFIGMEPQSIAIGGTSQVDVKMTESAVGLDEVVVVGYGTQKKVNVIGSVTTISAKEISTAPISNISNALAGRLNGAVVQQSGGEPGNNAATILVRGNATLGNNTPLIVVDGIPGRDMNTLNPSDIENISVLKDASAAIYGAAAANGVILVTTKHGKEGDALSVNYSFYEGFLSPTRLPKMADAPTYAQMIRELQSAQGVDEANMMFSADDVAKFKSGKYPWTYPNTDWYGAVIKESTQTRNHNISLSGSKGAINYYTSFGTQLDDGIFKSGSTAFRRYNIKSTIDAKVNQYLTLGFDFNFAQENKDYPSVSAGANFDALQRQFPTTPAIYPNGLAGPDNIGYGTNPVVTATNQTGFDNTTNYYLNNIFSASLKVPGINGLVLSTYYAYDILSSKEKLFQKPWTLYALDTQAYLAAGNTGAEDGSEFLIGSLRGPSDIWLRDLKNNSTNKTYNFKADYNTTINGVHNISAFVAYESSEYNFNSLMAYRRNLISYQLPYLFSGGQAQKDNGETVSIDARVNYFGRASYNYKEKYMVQVSMRRDGSLRFSKESGRWGSFPGVLAGWNISKEDFFQNNVKFINFLKLKASYGKLGNDRVAPFQYLSSYSISNGSVIGAGAYSVGLAQVGATNPNITWEVANIYNGGFESIFLKNKVTLNAEFFYERRSNILVKRNASVPQFTGITLPDENYGIVDSKGIEIVAGYNSGGKDFSYSINGNFAFARNKIVEFDEPAKQEAWQVLTGHPQGSILLYKAIGIYADQAAIDNSAHVPGARPGDIILQDYNKDGEIDAADRTLLFKTSVPEITYGISFSVTYKNLSLNGLLQGAGNMIKQVYTDYIGLSGNYLAYDAVDRWTPDHINATKPRAVDRTSAYWRTDYPNDFYYHKSGYMRMKSLQLTYNLPSALQDKLHLKNAQFFLSGQNLFLIYSKNKIMDPEIAGIFSYPLMKVYAIGARIGL
jgi:TonB-dependent starch-binding outer membrane protein SusC